MNKQAISAFPRVHFPGKVVVVITPEEAEKAVDYLLSQPIIGFDTETRPSFKKGEHFKCSLLQVSSEDYCFLFRLNLIGLAPAVVRLLGDKTVTKVGLAWSNDLLSLHQLGEFQAGTFVDLQDLVREIGIEDQSLVKIYANLFQERISKAERLSNWERDPLKDSQKQYAAIDAWACVKIYRELIWLRETRDFELIVVPEEPAAVPEENNQHDEANIS